MEQGVYYCSSYEICTWFRNKLQFPVRSTCWCNIRKIIILRIIHALSHRVANCILQWAVIPRARGAVLWAQQVWELTGILTFYYGHNLYWNIRRCPTSSNVSEAASVSFFPGLSNFIYLPTGPNWLGSPHLPFILITEADIVCETVLVCDAVCWTGSKISSHDCWRYRLFHTDVIPRVNILFNELSNQAVLNVVVQKALDLFWPILWSSSRHFYV
jgi:hypothetical protein